MKLIIGLGNPGREYEHTRHNMGFDVCDKFADALGFDSYREGYKGLYTRGKFYDEDICLLKPQTFMNLSGESTRLFVNFYKISIEDIIVIYDDMDIPVGHIKLKFNGSSGGHNGIKSIISNLGTQEFKRIRIGIGKPQFDSIDYVLGKPKNEEKIQIEEAQDLAVEALKVALKESFNKAMSLYNK